VKSGSSRTAASSAISRREVHAPDRGRGQRPPSGTWVAKVSILAALATATIAVPLLEVKSPEAVAAEAAQMAAVATYPTAFEVLSDGLTQATSTSTLAAAPGAQRVSDTSRSLDRSPLPDCNGQVSISSGNGTLPASDLCALWDGVNMLRGDAAISLAELNQNYRAATGSNLCITDSYRTLAEQRHLAYTKGGLAATPGTSNHGWGLAIDLCTSVTNNGTSMSWLRDNGPIYGWRNPDWAGSGGAGPHEPWHWEFTRGTVEMGTYYDD
jgi:D-alanyl-D-alanine carboxypeptidase